jgi:hypothetical protein
VPLRAAAPGRRNRTIGRVMCANLFEETSMKKLTLIVCAAFIGSTTLVSAFYTPGQNGFGNLSNVELVQAKKDEKKDAKKDDKAKKDEKKK